MTIAPSFDERLSSALHLADAGRTREAVAALAALVRERPQLLTVRHALVRGLLLAGEIERARAEAAHPTLLDADDVFRAVIGDFATAGAPQPRAALLELHLQRHPRDYDAALALAAAAHSLGCPSSALRWSGHALALRPGEQMPLEIRAASLIDRGDVEAGLAAYRELLRHGDAATAARYLVLMHYDPAQTNGQLFAAHRDFAQRHLHARGPAFARHARDPEKVLRVGWLSPRFGAGPVATFLDGLLACVDRTRQHHVLVDLLPTHDAAAQRLYSLAHETIDAGGLDDAALLRKLRSLDLDIAIDLAGHSTGNRLALLAERVAPLQVCWLDWFDTTAVPAMDAWISDAWLTPADSGQRFSERVVRLAAGRLCYTPLPGLPDQASPADTLLSPLREGAGVVVFGSFNRPAKFNDGVIDAWAAILRRLPQAQLELRARLLGETETCLHLRARFAERGIDPGRLHLRGELPYRDLLGAYRRIDIALDPFPFSGCTTTCDALWMGCPTIALAGETFVSRQSASLLWRLGRSEWVAKDHDDYVDRAVGLARDIDSIRSQRAALRDAVQARLCDASAQAADFAAALRDLWRSRAVA